jgi:hypothetical protein
MMLLFNESNSYATRDNAIKKLNKVLGERIKDVHWLITVNENGRFSPVVIGERNMHLIHAGICVAG